MDKSLSLPLSPYRQNKRAAMVARILETARQIMREEGAAALSMQELARRMGIRAPSLYNYFSSKMDVFDALFRLGMTMFAEHMTARFGSAQTWQEEVQNHFEGYMSFALQNPELYQLCFERPVPGFVPSPESLEVSLKSLADATDKISGLLPQMNTDLSTDQVVNLLIASIHGLTALHLANEPNLPAGEGRFGSLVPALLSVFDKAWKKQNP